MFDAVGRGVSIVGTDLSLANVVKLSGNFLIAAVPESLGEAFALVRKSGVDATPCSIRRSMPAMAAPSPKRKGAGLPAPP